jgi:hypothetical protein
LAKPEIGRRLGLGNFASAAQKTGVVFIIINLVLPGANLRSKPPAKSDRGPGSNVTRKATDQGVTRARLLESAHGWLYVKGEWVHPDGYKFVNNKVIRTTAKTGRALPKPPGKLALENAPKLESGTKPAAPSSSTRTPAEKAAEAREKNLTPTAAPQTGTHL